MLIEMLKYLHRTALSLYSNYVPCIIHNNSSSIRKTTKIPHFEDQNPQIPSYADTSFTNIIYTKSSTLPSSKISRIMHTSSTLSNKISNLPWLGAAATAKLSISLFEDSLRAKSTVFCGDNYKRAYTESFDISPELTKSSTLTTPPYLASQEAMGVT